MILPPLPPVLQLLASCAVERALPVLPAVIVAVGMRLAARELASGMEGPMRAAAREQASGMEGPMRAAAREHASGMEGPMRAAARELASSAAREVDGCTLSPPLREMVRV